MGVVPTAGIGEEFGLVIRGASSCLDLGLGMLLLLLLLRVTLED